MSLTTIAQRREQVPNFRLDIVLGFDRLGDRGPQAVPIAAAQPVGCSLHRPFRHAQHRGQLGVSPGFAG
jgi:hypothetical protein